ITELLESALGALANRCREENLQLGLRKHMRSDIPAIHNDSLAGCKLALHSAEYFPYGAACREMRYLPRHFHGPKLIRHVLAVHEYGLPVLARFQFDPDILHERLQLLMIIRRNVRTQRAVRYGSIHRAGVDVYIPQLPGDHSGNR